MKIEYTDGCICTSLTVDGTYEYIAQFYNGGTWLNEVLEEGLNNLK